MQKGLSSNMLNPFENIRKNLKKCLTNAVNSVRISLVLVQESEYGGIAQLARACGSYPQCHWFESDYRYQKFPVGNYGEF